MNYYRISVLVLLSFFGLIVIHLYFVQEEYIFSSYKNLWTSLVPPASQCVLVDYKTDCLKLMKELNELKAASNNHNCKFVEYIENEHNNNIWNKNYTIDEQDNPLVIKYLLDNHIFPIPKHNPLIPYPKGDGSEVRDLIQPLFKKFKTGFFIESGANDGIYLSNTLALERDHNWTGLLIEPNPLMWPKIRLANRQTWLANVGLSKYSYPEKIEFLHRIGDKKWFQGMGLTNRENDSRLESLPDNYVSLGSVSCFTLYIILKAIKVEIVDFLSLDIEGLELDVLRNYPFDKLPIKVILAEINLIPEGVGKFEDLLLSNAYVRIYTKKVNRIYGHINYLQELNYK